MIDFDSEGPEGREFLAFTTATGLSRFTDIPWPAGLAPKTDTSPATAPGGSLPSADVLVVTSAQMVTADMVPDAARMQAAAGASYSTATDLDKRDAILGGAGDDLRAVQL
jgi:hypothetical protein